MKMSWVLLPAWDWNFSQALEQDSRRQPDKGDHSSVQELQLSHQNV